MRCGDNSLDVRGENLLVGSGMAGESREARTPAAALEEQQRGTDGKKQGGRGQPKCRGD